MSGRSRLSLIFAGGGTGGHLFPALAIADRFRERLAESTDLNIIFVGTRRGIEYNLRENLGYPLRLINIRGIIRSFSLKNLLVPFLIVGALMESSRILTQEKPDVVIGTGGYVAWPVLRAAQNRRIPTVLQEQNSYPGMVTRRCAPKAERVYLGFERAKQFLNPETHTITTGNPVRDKVVGGNREEALAAFKLDPAKKTILILGGSQGARALNHAVLDDLRTGQLDDRFQLLWQTGTIDYTDILTAAGAKAEGHALLPFSNRMDLLYAAADVAVARAGASTLSELMANNIPAILIPYPFAAGDHQRHNAQSMVDDGFAEMIDQNAIRDGGLLNRVIALEMSGSVEVMRNKMKLARTGKKPAVDMIVDDILELVRHHKEKVVAG